MRAVIMVVMYVVIGVLAYFAAKLGVFYIRERMEVQGIATIMAAGVALWVGTWSFRDAMEHNRLGASRAD